MNVHWLLVTKLFAMGLFMGGMAWYQYRRSRRPPYETWRVCPGAWTSACFLFGSVFVLAMVLTQGTPLPRDLSRLTFIVVCAAAVLGLVGGLIHALVVWRWQKRPTMDHDYADNSAGNIPDPTTARREPPP